MKTRLRKNTYLSLACKAILPLAIAILSLNFQYALAQAPDQSGIIYSAGTNGEEFNHICIKFENSISADQESSIHTEYNKYPGIKSIVLNVNEGYIYLKYTNEISANQLLAILDKINLPGHYLSNGVPTYYQKDNSIYFIR